VNDKNDRDEYRMASGRLFQKRGPAMVNDLSLNEACVRGTRSFILDVGRHLDDRTLPGIPEHDQ